LDCQGEEQKLRRDLAEYDPERRHWTRHDRLPGRLRLSQLHRRRIGHRAHRDTITIITGTLDYGHGRASPSAQVLSMRLGIPARSARCKAIATR
jgi:hypothetical protein